MKPFNLEAALAGKPTSILPEGCLYGVKSWVVRSRKRPDRLLVEADGYIVKSVDEKALVSGVYYDSGVRYEVQGMWEEPLTFEHWDAVDDKWQFIAEDQSGFRYFYALKPTRSEHSWIPNSDCATQATPLKWDTKGRDWKDTLVERPK